MTLAGLLDATLSDTALADAVARAGAPAFDLTAPPALRAFAVAALAADPARGGAGRTVFAVTATTREGRGPARRAGRPAQPRRGRPCCRPGRRCRTSGSPRGRTPSDSGWPCCDGWRTRPATIRRPGRSGSSSRRYAACCSRWSPVSATWSRSPSTADDEVDLDRMVEALVDIGYARVDLVEKRGELAVRGGIVDVFPPTEEHPVRVEFFGDTVEEIRAFAVADQARSGRRRRSERAEHGLWAPPCRELLLTPAVRERAKEQAAVQAAAGRPSWLRCSTGSPTGHRGRGHGVARAGAGRRAATGAARPAGAAPTSCVCDPERVRARAVDLVRTSEEFLGRLLGGRGLWRSGADRPGRGGLPRRRRPARDRGRARHPVVDRHAVHRGCGAGGRTPR